MDPHQQEVLESRQVEDEIDLWELLQVVWRYKWLIVILFVVAIGSAFIVSKTMTPVYKVTTSYMLAEPKILPVKDAISLLNTFFEGRGLEVGGMHYPLQKFKVMSDKKSANVIKISFQTNLSKSPETAFQKEMDVFLKEFFIKAMKPNVTEDLIDLNNRIKLYESELNLTKQRLVAEERTANVLMKRYAEMEGLNKKLKRENKREMLAAKILLQNRLSELQNRLSLLRESIYSQKLYILSKRNDLDSLKRQRKEKLKLAKGEGVFIQLVPPVRSANPVKPRPLLIVAIAGMLALFVGVFLAFLIEFIRKNRTNSVQG